MVAALLDQSQEGQPGIGRKSPINKDLRRVKRPELYRKVTFPVLVFTKTVPLPPPFNRPETSF